MHIWPIAICDSETWMLNKRNEKKLDDLRCGVMTGMSWEDEHILKDSEENKQLLNIEKKGTLSWQGHNKRHGSLLLEIGKCEIQGKN